MSGPPPTPACARFFFAGRARLRGGFGRRRYLPVKLGFDFSRNAFIPVF
jgi:hypothetical protein